MEQIPLFVSLSAGLQLRIYKRFLQRPRKGTDAGQDSPKPSGAPLSSLPV